MKKSDENIYIDVNYRKFNDIIIKNQYFISQFQKTFNQLIKIKFYMKVNIISAFNKL